MNKNQVMTAAAVAILSSWAATGTAHAETATGSFGVSATLVKECTVNTASLPAAFGNTKGITELTKDANSSTSLGITCTNSTPYTVQFDSTNKDETQFRMKSGSNYLKYGIFTGSSSGVAVAPATDIAAAASTGTSAEKTTSFYFKLQDATSSNLPLGAYTDTVTVTVTY